jgi:hypothetical protein
VSINFPVLKHVVQVVNEVEDEGKEKVHRIHKGRHYIESSITVGVVIIFGFLRELKGLRAENKG